MIAICFLIKYQLLEWDSLLKRNSFISPFDKQTVTCFLSSDTWTDFTGVSSFEVKPLFSFFFHN